MLESLFNKVTCNFIKKRLQHRRFPVNIANFKNTYFEKHLRTTASDSSYILHRKLFLLKQKITLFYLLSFAFISFITRCHSLLLIVIFCYSLPFIVTRCHSLSFVVPCCTNRCDSLSFVVPLVVIRFHLLSIDVQLVYLFINDHTNRHVNLFFLSIIFFINLGDNGK